MRRFFFITICVLTAWPQISPPAWGRLANEGKRGLYVRSIEQLLQLSEDEVDLATAALIVSERWSDLVMGRRYLARLDEMAVEIQKRLRRGRLALDHHAIPIINQYLFDELGFNTVSEANDPNDLFLHSVLDKKQGYCLSLSILYLSLGERLGIPMYGVVVPGHFFVRYDDGRTRWNIETTHAGTGMSDGHYVEKFNVPTGNKNTIYLKNLDKIQTLGCLFNNLGNTYADLGETDSALATLQLAVEINPALAESRANLGNIYLKMDLIDEAITEYHNALRVNPADPKTHSNLGNAYVRKGWLREAIAEYSDALQLDPEFVDAHKNLAIAHCKDKQYQRAIQHLNEAATLDRNDAGLYNQFGEVYYQMGKYEKAIFQYKKALSINEAFAESNFGLAACYYKLGLSDEEITAYRRALSIKPDMLAALVNLGNAYFRKQDYDAAIEQYAKAAQRAPRDAWIHYNLATAYTNKGNFKKAVDAYRTCVEIDPNMGDAHYGLAFGFYKLHKYQSAWKHIKIAQKLGVEITQDHLDAIKRSVPAGEGKD